jgi:hypothetical protein
MPVSVLHRYTAYSQTSWFIAAMVRMLAVYYYSYMTGEGLFRGLGVLANE